MMIIVSRDGRLDSFISIVGYAKYVPRKGDLTAEPSSLNGAKEEIYSGVCLARVCVLVETLAYFLKHVLYKMKVLDRTNYL